MDDITIIMLAIIILAGAICIGALVIDYLEKRHQKK